ncbi:hypothetical protein E1B28_012125 [Marasmius oreades]|uniref:Uncharacterized protein n=1 Tax=Marasmius oreades TaxID=181124 RepID=A0A9P7UNL8_9AGAR|nr:uncharacterized protein E1B28_012125 [Marasmius oreades]KAG7088100.1 hypothetical protein E1B28_012125 [Marasmius oreades]
MFDKSIGTPSPTWPYEEGEEASSSVDDGEEDEAKALEIPNVVAISTNPLATLLPPLSAFLSKDTPSVNTGALDNDLLVPVLDVDLLEATSTDAPVCVYVQLTRKSPKLDFPLICSEIGPVQNWILKNITSSVCIS